MIEENDDYYDSILDDIDMAILMEEDVDSESGSQNGVQGVNAYVENPDGLWLPGKDQRPQGKRIPVVADGHTTNKPFL